MDASKTSAAPALGAASNDSQPDQARTGDAMPLQPPTENADPFEGMTDRDRYGLKGLRVMMNSYPDYAAMMQGIDPADLGLDMSSTE